MSFEGLSSQEAAELIMTAGPNAVPSPGKAWWKRLAAKFWSPVPWMLEATGGLEIVLGRWTDAALVLAVLALNAGIGFVQEGRARSALELLRSRLEVNARVLRDGNWALLPAAGLVPRDVVHLRMGDFVPADVTVLDGEVLADESGLTGESVPVERGEGASLYSGTVLVRGEATGRVTATGKNTYFGRTAQLVGTSAPTEHLGRLVMRMVRVFIALDLVLAASGTAYLAANGEDLDTVLSFAIVLLLASVPVALPAAFTLAGALGARRLAALGILTTRLSILQDAASMDILCVDKTGTLTQNRLTVDRVRPADGTSVEEVLHFAAAASDEATQDPIDLAVLAHARVQSEWNRTGFIPFDPATKRSEASLAAAGQTLQVTKGSPAAIAILTGVQPGPALQELARSGARVLSVAVRNGASPWQPLGLISLADTVRDDAKEMLGRLGAVGVRAVMVTGDSAQTAQAVASRLGISGEVITADSLGDADGDLTSIAAVAQVLPEHKHQLVRRLQDAGHTVGMTGDGVNDAPALRQAEVGIAVEGATDVAKAAAGAVLTRGGLTDIVALVEESRRIHQRSLTYALNVSVKKLEVPLLLAMGVFAWREFVFTPLLMALLLLANDVVSMAVTTDRARPSARPDSWHVGNVIAAAAAVALPMLAASAAILWGAHELRTGIDELRTIIFVTLVLSSQATIYIVRTGSHAWRDRPSGWLLAATAATLVATGTLALAGWFMYPIPPLSLAAVTAAILIGALVSDALKAAVFPRLRLHAPG
jgi:H+-transporting ATPase